MQTAEKEPTGGIPNLGHFRREVEIDDFPVMRQHDPKLDLCTLGYVVLNAECVEKELLLDQKCGSLQN